MFVIALGLIAMAASTVNLGYGASSFILGVLIGIAGVVVGVAAFRRVGSQGGPAAQDDEDDEHGIDGPK